MPQIPEYTASQPGIAAPETGVEAFAQAGRRIGTFYHQEGEELGGAIKAAGEGAQKYLDHQEISHGAVAEAGLFNKFTQQWNEIAKQANPNDPTVATRFRAQIEPELEDFANSFHTEAGQKWAESRVDAMRSHIFQSTTATMAILAGNAVKQNSEQIQNAYSNAAAADPASIKAAIKMYGQGFDAQIEAAGLNLTAEQASALQEHRFKGIQQIVYAGVTSAIRQNPDAGIKMARDPELAPYINAAEIKKFEDGARAMNKMMEVQNRQALLLQRQLDEQAVHVAENKAWDQYVKVDPATGKFTIDPKYFSAIGDMVHNHSTAANAVPVAQGAVNWAQAQQRERAEPVISDPQIKSKYIESAYDPNVPLNKLEMDILTSSAKHELSPHDTTALREMVKQMQESPIRGEQERATMQAVHDDLTFTIPGLAGVKDTEGEARYAGFLQRFTDEVIREQRAGTLPPNAFNMQDPKSLISQMRDQFQRDPRDKLRDAMSWANQFQSATDTAAGIAGSPKLPLVGQREVGKTYQTARGPMKWTGTGWVTP